MKFYKGQPAWNKGKKGSIKPNSGSFKKGQHISVRTQFKVGQKVRLGRKHSEETKNKISLNRAGKTAGDKNPAWKGGVTIERQRLMNTREYKLWRKAVFERDNYTCVWCGIRGFKIEADHIKKWSDYPELRFAIDNGRTLCQSCHKKTDTYGRKKPNA